jgi:hypothetical protein
LICAGDLLHRHQLFDRRLEERYPIDAFPNFWRLFEGAIQAGRVVAPQAVHDETEKKSQDLHAWLADRDGLFTALDEPAQREVRAILARHPRLVMEKKQRFAADPFTSPRRTC